MTGMSQAAYELPADDPAAAAEAVRRAAAGERVHLVRDGQAVVDVLPHESDARRARAEADRLGREVEDFIVAFTGKAPSFDDYRRVYAQLGEPYPGDDEIARTCPVAS